MKKLLALAVCLGLAGSAQAQLALETFDGGTFPPSGWTVIDNLTASSSVWDTLANYNQTNQTPGWGEAACVDSDDAGSTVDQDTELWTPSFVVPAGASLLFANDWNTWSAGIEQGDVDISTDGGSTWTTLRSFLTGVDERTTSESIDLSAYAGQTAIIRFYYYNGDFDYWWIIDNVRTGTANTFDPGSCGFTPVWVEDFEGGVFPPAGWTTTDQTTVGTMVWSISSLTQNGSIMGLGDAAAFDANTYGDTLGLNPLDLDCTLVSAPIAIPATGAYNIEFALNHQAYASEGDLDFDISTDGGVTWTTLETWVDDTPGGGSPTAGFVTVSYDATPYAGQSVNLRWRFYETSTTPTLLWFSQVDNVALWDQATSIQDASATFRNDTGGNNLNMLDVSGPPVMGELWAALVDLSPSGLGYTQIFGYAGQLSLNIGGTSRVILTDLTHPGGEILGAPIQPGPDAFYTYTIPAQCSLVGFAMTVQAAGFNIPNNAPWVLSNAQDLVLGF